ncbi:MAG: type 1 glutamine amidotransferase [Pseudoclavibacter sp.]
MSIDILHLYPRELGINGDVGNVMALARRGAAYGLDIRVIEAGLGDALPERADFVHVGSGPLSAIETVLPDAARHADRLLAWRDGGVPFLGISGGWQLLGKSIRTEDGRSLAGLGVFPTTAVRGAAQAVAETVLQTPGGTVAGYVNHDAITSLEDGASSFGQIVHGFGNLGADSPDAGLEGVVVGPSIGTHLHGTVLALNPIVADGMLVAALRAQSGGANGAIHRPTGDAGEWLDRVDDYARRAREAIIGRTGAQATA